MLATASKLASFPLLFIGAWFLIGGGKEYHAGNSEELKTWQIRTFDQVKEAALPVCIYIYDPNVKYNQVAEQFENELMKSDEVKKKLLTFLTVKLRKDAKIQEGKVLKEMTDWPQSWLQSAEGGAVLILASSDLGFMLAVDRGIPPAKRTAQFLKEVSSILEYEQKKKLPPSKLYSSSKPKEPEDTPEAKPLTGLVKDPKKDSKPPPSKKPAGPENE